MSTQLGISQESWKNSAYHRSMSGFGAIEWLARVGFLVKGVLYMVIGHGPPGRSRGRRTRHGDTRRTHDRPRTTIRPDKMLVAAIGLFGYAAWRVLQGLFDADRLGHDWGGLAIRATFVVPGSCTWCSVGRLSVYSGLSGSSGTSEREVATEAFQWPLGDWLVVLAGLSFIGFAVQQVYAAITCRLERNLDVEKMRHEAGEWAVGLSRFGVAARAVVFALLGWAIVVAGWFRDPSEVGTTASFPYARCTTGRAGPLALGVTAAGFVVQASTRSSTRAIYISDESGETAPVRPRELLGKPCTPEASDMREDVRPIKCR